MISFNSTNPLSYLSPQRMNQIVSEAFNNHPVVRTWPEYWRDFLTHCIHCCDGNGITNQEIIDHVWCLFSAQRGLLQYFVPESVNPPAGAEEGCRHAFTMAYYNAKALASIANNAANNDFIEVATEGDTTFETAFDKAARISISIKTKNCGKTLFSLCRSIQQINPKPVYQMTTIIKGRELYDTWRINDEDKCERIMGTLTPYCVGQLTAAEIDMAVRTGFLESKRRNE